MVQLVYVNSPLNLLPENASLYEPFRSYRLEKQRVKYLKNVFVAFSGFCLNNKGLIKESHHNYPVHLPEYLNEAASYYHQASDNPENLVVINDINNYLIIHHPWYNYFHWITEPIFRLWMVRKHLNDMVLILPEYYRHADFIMGSLEPFRIKRIYFIPNGKSLLIRNLCIPPIKPICDSFNAYHLKQIRRFYTKYVLTEKQYPKEGAERIYVSRELASRRRIVNEDSVQKIVLKYEFKIFHPEQVSFLEQVAIFSKIKFLIGTHGSALTNILFMSKGSSLLELHKEKTNELDHPSPLFWYMADALGINYYHQLCDTFGKEDYFTGDYIVDEQRLEANIRSILRLSDNSVNN